MAGVRIRALTTPRLIKLTSTRCRSARQLNIGRRSTYQGGDSVQTTGATSPGRHNSRRMRFVQAHLTDLMIVAIKYGDLVRRLQQLRWALRKNERHPGGPTLVARVRIADALQPEFGVLLHDLRRLRLQDRIGVVAHQLEDVAGAVRPALPVDQRRAPGRQRLEPGNRMVPDAREIRDGCAALLAAMGCRPNRGRYRLRGGGRH